MSFRLNSYQKEVSDRSFWRHGNELFADSIGITENGTSLGCVMDIDAKQYKYFKSQSVLFQIFAKMQQKKLSQAFLKIQKVTHYHQQKINAVFLPQALSKGNYSVMTNFLQKLRTNKIGSYLNLNIKQNKGYFLKAATLIKPSVRMVRARIKVGFLQLKRHMIQDRQRDKRQMILNQLEGISSIDHKDTEYSDKDKKIKSNAIKIKYRRVEINPQRISQFSTQLDFQHFSARKMQSTQTNTARKIRCISINDLKNNQKVQVYRYQNKILKKYSIQKSAKQQS